MALFAHIGGFVAGVVVGLVVRGAAPVAPRSAPARPTGSAWDNRGHGQRGAERRNGLVEMVVESVRVHMLSSRHVVILKETEHDRYLPIWIGPWEASAIAMKLQGLTADRPLTHDLFASALENLGVRVDRVVISTLAEETYHARLHLERDGTTFEIDSRPSDALALAVRTGGRIFASEAVLEQAALGGDAPRRRRGRASSPRARRSSRPARRIVDPRLDIFRDFVNSLDVDPEHRRGPDAERPDSGRAGTAAPSAPRIGSPRR